MRGLGCRQELCRTLPHPCSVRGSVAFPGRGAGQHTSRAEGRCRRDCRCRFGGRDGQTTCLWPRGSSAGDLALDPAPEPPARRACVCTCAVGGVRACPTQGAACSTCAAVSPTKATPAGVRPSAASPAGAGRAQWAPDRVLAAQSRAWRPSGEVPARPGGSEVGQPRPCLRVSAPGQAGVFSTRLKMVNKLASEKLQGG